MRTKRADLGYTEIPAARGRQPAETDRPNWHKHSWPPSARRHSIASTSRSSRRCSATDARPSRSWRRRSGLSARACLERVRRLEASGVIAGYQAVVELARLSRPVNVFAEIILEKQANRGRFEKRLAALEEVVECWEVSGTVDYLARFVCADLAAYEELTSALIDDENLGVARIVSHVALRPVRRFAGYPESLLRARPDKTLTIRRFGRSGAALTAESAAAHFHFRRTSRSRDIHSSRGRAIRFAAVRVSAETCHESHRSREPLQRSQLRAASRRAGARARRASVGHRRTALRRHDERLFGGQPRPRPSAHPRRAHGAGRAPRRALARLLQRPARAVSRGAVPS